jgi:tRNA(Met) C34 N-acetyltransferase TmcA
MKQIHNKLKFGKLDTKDNDDPFELFVASTNIRYCYYNETHKVLGNTFGMLILQVRFFKMLNNFKPNTFFFLRILKQ